MMFPPACTQNKFTNIAKQPPCQRWFAISGQHDRLTVFGLPDYEKFGICPVAEEMELPVDIALSCKTMIE